MNYITNTVAATQFTDALEKDDFEVETMPGVRADSANMIRTVIVRSKENLAWEVSLNDSDGNILSSHAFTISDGHHKIIDGVDYYYYTHDVEWPVFFNKTELVYFQVANRSTDAKTAGTNGELILYIRYTRGR